jgi:hypothetical protein
LAAISNSSSDDNLPPPPLPAKQKAKGVNSVQKAKAMKLKAEMEVTRMSYVTPMYIALTTCQELSFQIPFLQRSTKVYTIISIDVDMPFDSLTRKIFQSAHADDCLVDKRPNLLVHLSKDKKTEKYSLDTPSDWELLIKHYCGELEKKGDDTRVEVSFNPETVRLCACRRTPLH